LYGTEKERQKHKKKAYPYSCRALKGPCLHWGKKAVWTVRSMLPDTECVLNAETIGALAMFAQGVENIIKTDIQRERKIYAQICA
jgi:hypothetical protein